MTISLAVVEKAFTESTLSVDFEVLPAMQHVLTYILLVFSRSSYAYEQTISFPGQGTFNALCGIVSERVPGSNYAHYCYSPYVEQLFHIEELTMAPNPPRTYASGVFIHMDQFSQISAGIAVYLFT